ncbi:sporulation integral membrane protein YtvI [Marvinbryantia formatexigens]|nr:sporulation integral membrane protein YtvI [Marvinbryantia formatexigens]UWO23238.1 sporulation integral membrane protein YtvI [Marvinbryantia formatexigens DSM 14469]SDG60487.1 sporulation integral membrane protein YtvI [Marvinbryantia formatexigens]
MHKPYKDAIKLTGIAIAVFLGMKYILPVAIPFFIAWVLVRFLMPGAVFLEEKLHLKKVLAGGILLVLLTGAAGIALYLLGSTLIRQVCNLAANFDIYMQKAENLLKVCCSAVEKNTGIHAQAVENFIYDNMLVVEQRLQTYAVPDVLKNSISYLMSMLEWLGVVLIVFVSYMLILKDYEKLGEVLKKYGIYERTRKINAAMMSLGGAWLRAQLLIILTVTIICVAGLALLGYPYALLLGIVIGLLDALPFIGTGTILVPWGVIQMFTGKFWLGVCLIVLFLIINTLREFLEPKLIGDRMGIYPIAMVAAVYVGICVYGVAGVVLGPISLMLIIEIFREMREEKDMK